MANCCCIEPEYCTEFSSERVVMARKQHRCGECREVIKTGDQYLYEAIKYDGDFSTHKTCARCANVRHDYFKCGFTYGDVCDDFKECFGFDYRNGIPKDFTPCSGNTNTYS